MQRIVSKSLKLMTFRADLDEIEVLVTELSGLFQGLRPSRLELSWQIHDELITFESIEEIRATANLPARLTRFKIRLAGEIPSNNEARPYSSVTIDVSALGASVSAISPLPSWCAGAIELTVRFARLHKVWIPGSRYGRSIWSLLAAALLLSLGTTTAGQKMVGASWLTLAGWISLVVLFAAIALGSFRIPAAILDIKESESWWKKHSIELTLGGMVLGVLLNGLAVVAAFMAAKH